MPSFMLAIDHVHNFALKWDFSPVWEKILILVTILQELIAYAFTELLPKAKN